MSGVPKLCIIARQNSIWKAAMLSGYGIELEVKSSIPVFATDLILAVSAGLPNKE